ncbi:hypothetical protein [Celeribacter neptunius]|uniref:Polyketide cyclase / dehydrase and lipid transport n=1 Tax=Celeribacter neptunius TaxID=588602 RepID=A0A1I3KTK9_9RHOB|nr:hypothetical protein [Celeribacter neptunius]SFI75823.1 hypothetical protein SAMN04487991_0796 [Celeribacter neptunius]
MTRRDGKRTFIFALLTSASVAALPLAATTRGSRSGDDVDRLGEATEVEIFEGRGNLHGSGLSARLASDLTVAIRDRLQSMLDEAVSGPLIWAEAYHVRVDVTGMPDDPGGQQATVDRLPDGWLLEGQVYIDAPETEMPMRKYRIALPSEGLAQIAPGDCEACYAALVDGFAAQVVRDAMRLPQAEQGGSSV